MSILAMFTNVEVTHHYGLKTVAMTTDVRQPLDGKGDQISVVVTDERGHWTAAYCLDRAEAQKRFESLVKASLIGMNLADWDNARR